MRYSYEYKKMCVELYRQGKWVETPEGVKEKNFRNMIQIWARTEESCGVEALRHKNQNKVWTAEEKYELVAKVLAGESNRTTAIAAGIDKGLLYSWVRCYKMKGYQGLASQRKGRPPKEPDMKKKVAPAELTPSEREEMILLRAENERLRAEIAVVKKEIENVKSLGVEIETNAIVGKSITIDGLFEEGYEAVFIGSGAGLPKFMGIPGEQANGVFSANEYLTRSNLMKAFDENSNTPIMHGKKVAVVGGGNVAMDAARTALRLGAETHIVYRRSEEELPARAEEVHHAKEEGIIFDLLTNPIEVLTNDDGWVSGIRCIKMELGEPDASGRRRPVEIEGSEFDIEADMVIMSLGTSPNPLISSTTEGLDINKRGCIIANEETGLTSRDGVFAGGDAVTGAATVILAMGAGKAAAAGIHEYLQNK